MATRGKISNIVYSAILVSGLFVALAPNSRANFTSDAALGTNDGTTIPAAFQLSNYVCVDDPSQAGSFGLTKCADFKTTINANLQKQVSHMIANFYAGRQVQPVFTFGNPGDPNSAVNFCQQLDPTAPAGTPPASAVLTIDTPLCNIADPHSTTGEKNQNYLGQNCVNPKSATHVDGYINADSKGYCDYAVFFSNGTGGQVDLEQVCPREILWMRGLRPQTLMSKYDEVTGEINSGTLTLYKDPVTSKMPCDYLSKAIERSANGVLPPGTVPQGNNYVPGFNQLRQAVIQVNKDQANQADNIKQQKYTEFNDKVTCSLDNGKQGQNSFQNALTVSRGGGTQQIFEGAACQMIFAEKYLEFLFGELALCEVHFRAEAQYFSTLQNAANLLQGAIDDLLTPCVANSTNLQTPPLTPNQPFWDPVTAVQPRSDFYKCYINGTGLTGDASGGVASYFKKKVNGFINPIPTGFPTPTPGTSAQRFNFMLDVTGNPMPTPPCTLSLEGIFIGLAAALRRRKNKARLLALLFMTTIAVAPQTAYAGFKIKIKCSLAGKSTVTDPAVDKCICTAKKKACKQAALNQYNARYSKINDYYTNVALPALASTNPDYRWSNNECDNYRLDPKNTTECREETTIDCHWANGGYSGSYDAHRYNAGGGPGNCGSVGSGVLGYTCSSIIRYAERHCTAHILWAIPVGMSFPPSNIYDDTKAVSQYEYGVGAVGNGVNGGSQGGGHWIHVANTILEADFLACDSAYPVSCSDTNMPPDPWNGKPAPSNEIDAIAGYSTDGLKGDKQTYQSEYSSVCAPLQAVATAAQLKNGCKNNGTPPAPPAPAISSGSIAQNPAERSLQDANDLLTDQLNVGKVRKQISQNAATAARSSTAAIDPGKKDSAKRAPAQTFSGPAVTTPSLPGGGGAANKTLPTFGGLDGSEKKEGEDKDHPAESAATAKNGTEFGGANTIAGQSANRINATATGDVVASSDPNWKPDGAEGANGPKSGPAATNADGLSKSGDSIFKIVNRRYDKHSPEMQKFILY